jgi:basic membrane protein A
MRRAFGLAVVSVLLMTLVSPAAAAPGAEKKPATTPQIGLVTGGGPLYDYAYNQYAWEGVQTGAEAIDVGAAVVETRRAHDYARNIRSLVRNGAVVIVTVGFTMAEATLAAAQANPSVQFIGIDQDVAEGGPPNYQGLIFDHAQSGYLAGIVAATMSTSGTIGAVGGMSSIPPVLAYINGYRNGAASVDADITVLVAYTEDFGSPEKGASAANELIDADADVVFGVAGGTNLGILQAACNRGVWGIGVDVDQYLQIPAFQACTLTSAENRIATATAGAIGRWFAATPGFQSGMFLNDASNLGIGLAPIRNTVPSAELVATLAAAYAGLADDSIKPCEPIACNTP